ncbi:hypothetical protein N2152v2_010805 [Parachlorella kessleri]
MEVRRLVAQLFERLGEGQQDDAVYDYVASLLAEEDTNINDLRELLEGFLPTFAGLASGEQLDLTSRLLTEAHNILQQQQQQQCLKQGPVGDKEHSQVCQQSICLSVTAPSRENTPSQQQQPSHNVDVLRQLCGIPLDDGFLQHLLTTVCSGSLQAAAAHVLDSTDIAEEERAWRTAEARRQAEREQAEQEMLLNRQKILTKFQLEAVSEGPPRKPQQVQAWSSKEGGNTKTRFRDGCLVSTKGDKYVFEKAQDWDGGSRGKVYTKGKRGKGFA